MSKEMTLSWFGEKLFISLILLIIFLLGAMIGATIASKTRIKKLEDKIVKLEVLDDRATKIWEEIQTIKQFKDGSDRSEASMSLKTVNLVNGSGSLTKYVPEERHQRAEPSKQSKASRKRYHTVRDGGTYSISPPL